MREIARRAGVSTGTLYHHFAAKDELVFDYYRSLQGAMHLEARNLFVKHRRLEDRLTLLLGAFVARMSLDRETLSQIARAAMEPGNPLSPFSAETEAVRAQAIAVQAELLAGSSITVPEDLRAHLPHLLWLLQMGVFLYWLHDSSEGQSRTRLLIRTAGALVPKLIRLASLPVMRGIRRELLTAFEGLGVTEKGGAERPHRGR